MNTESTDGRWIHRSGLFIVASQLEGLCQALRVTVSHGLPTGTATVTMLKKLQNDFLSFSTGRSLQNFPDINNDLSPVDILVIAETLRMTVLSFLSPDELSDQRQAIGFAAEATSKSKTP